MSIALRVEGGGVPASAAQVPLLPPSGGILLCWTGYVNVSFWPTAAHRRPTADVSLVSLCGRRTGQVGKRGRKRPRGDTTLCRSRRLLAGRSEATPCQQAVGLVRWLACSLLRNLQLPTDESTETLPNLGMARNGCLLAGCRICVDVMTATVTLQVTACGCQLLYELTAFHATSNNIPFVCAGGWSPIWSSCEISRYASAIFSSRS